MALMDKLAKIDSSLQRGLDNGFAAVFGGRVVPAELEELLKQEAQDGLRADEDDNIIAPNVYAVGVSSKDLENLSQDMDLPTQLAGQITRFVRNLDWGLFGPVVVRIAEESGLRTGQLRVSSYIDESPDVDSGFDAILADRAAPAYPSDPVMPAAPAPLPQEAEMNQPYEEPQFAPTPASVPPQPARSAGPSVSLLLQDGTNRTYQVREGSTILGRSNDADFRLPDTGVSRQHAEIVFDGSTAFLVDLQSTNGTTVNDQPIDNWELADGDVISIGHSNIEVRIGAPQGMSGR